MHCDKSKKTTPSPRSPEQRSQVERLRREDQIRRDKSLKAALNAFRNPKPVTI